MDGDMGAGRWDRREEEWIERWRETGGDGIGERGMEGDLGDRIGEG